jgi:hypothetical protein
MGGRNPDNAIFPPSPLIALTLAEIAAAGWTLQARCDRCGITLRASVDMLIRLHGPHVVWWGQKPRCPTTRDGCWCEGRMTYWAQATPHGSWSVMKAVSQREVEAHRLARDPHERRQPRRVDPAREGS